MDTSGHQVSVNQVGLPHDPFRSVLGGGFGCWTPLKTISPFCPEWRCLSSKEVLQQWVKGGGHPRSPSTGWLQSDMSSVVKVDGRSSYTVMSLSGLLSEDNFSKVTSCLVLAGLGDLAHLTGPHSGTPPEGPAMNDHLAGIYACGSKIAYSWQNGSVLQCFPLVELWLPAPTGGHLSLWLGLFCRNPTTCS